MPPGFRSRLLLGIDQVQFAWRSILRERSAAGSDRCFLASTYWRLDDDRRGAARRGERTEGVQAITKAAFELIESGLEEFGRDLEVEAPTHSVWMRVGWEAMR
jgi:hypothetical protein